MKVKPKTGLLGWSVDPVSVSGALLVLAMAGQAWGQVARDESAAAEEPALTTGPGGADPAEEFGYTQRGPKKEEEAEAPAAEAEESAFSFAISVDYTTAYFSRGMRWEDRGFIVQPGGELGFDLYENDSFSIGGFVGIWNSFHDRATGADENEDITDKWYEADLYVGAGGSVGKFGYSVSYLAYTSPSGAWDTIDEILFELNYDDSEWWGESGFSLTPSLTLAFEIGSTGADLADGENGVYLAPGITPAFGVDDLGFLKHVDFSFPLVVGVSLSEYYEDSTGEDHAFGFFSVSAKAGIPLAVPEEYGNWTLTGGVQFMILGDTPEELNDGENTAWVGTVGLSIEF